LNSIVDVIFDSVIHGKSDDVESKVQEALDTGVSPREILDEGMISAMTEVGQRFEHGDFYVPEMLIAARAMRAGIAILNPQLVDGDVRSAGKVVIGTVKGDLHDIGKNLVAMMLEGAGFEVVDLGTDVQPAKFIEAIEAEGAQLVGMSALLTTTMQNMKTTIEAIKTSDLFEEVKIMVGGAPVTEAFACEIGADGYATDASRAAALAWS
jgi:5-methyltetrahydrofolate--homocysteine methyltransferase